MSSEIVEPTNDTLRRAAGSDNAATAISRWFIARLSLGWMTRVHSLSAHYQCRADEQPCTRKVVPCRTHRLKPDPQLRRPITRP